MTPVEKGPFVALKFGPALLAIVDGLDVDTQLRVLNREGEPIEGLWAVGNCAGGLYGVDYPVLLNGNSHGRAMTWGKVAAESIMGQR
jgi:predicted oxidoreductase